MDWEKKAVDLAEALSLTDDIDVFRASLVEVHGLGVSEGLETCAKMCDANALRLSGKADGFGPHDHPDSAHVYRFAADCMHQLAVTIRNHRSPPVDAPVPAEMEVCRCGHFRRSHNGVGFCDGYEDECTCKAFELWTLKEQGP